MIVELNIMETVRDIRPVSSEVSSSEKTNQALEAPSANVTRVALMADATDHSDVDGSGLPDG